MRRWVWTTLVVAALLALLLVLGKSSSTAPAPEASLAWRVVGQVGGPTQAVAVQGNYAYVGVGLRLVVLDVSNPVTLTEVGSTTPFPYFVEDVVVSGTLAYVAAGGAGLRVVSILTPTAPVEVGAWDSPGYAEGVAVAGDTVYLADGPYGLRVVDVTDPTHPTPLGSAYDMNYAFEVVVSGHYAYVAAAGAGLLVADVSDPAHPVESGSLDTPGYAYGIAVSGTIAYVADAWEGLRVVDVSNPLSPTVIGVCDTPGWALNVAVAGSTAYVADGAFGQRIVDLSDPAHPHEVGAYEVDGLARRVAIADGMAYVADLRGGLRTIDVADPSHSAQVSLYSPLADARRVAVAGDYAYVAAGFSGLRVIDIFDPAHPKEAAAYDAEGGYATAVVISGTYAYLATYIHGPYNLHVVDVSDPAHPARVGAISTEGAYRDLSLLENILYVADESGLRLIDVGDPTAPAELGFIPLDQNDQATVGIAVSGTFAYVADAADRVKIVDVSNPYSPTLTSVCCSNWHWVTGVALSGDTLYAAVHTAGLHIADISDPAHPFEVGSYDTSSIAGSVTVSGTEAYVSDSGGGMVVVDVSNPFTPTLAAAHDTAGFAGHTALAGNHAFVADGHGGLAILERTAGGTTGRLESRSGNPSGLNLVDTAAGASTLTKISGMAGPRITASATDPSSNTSGFSTPVILASITYTVTSALDNGPDTLRQALLDAKSGDTITFDPAVFPPAYPTTIALENPLPWIAQGYLTIDASNSGVILDGSALPAALAPIGIAISSDNNVIMGLQITHFHGDGIDVEGANNVIGGDRMQGSGPVGQGNLINGSGNGIAIRGGTSNLVIGNLIGTDVTGRFAIPNQFGVGIDNGAAGNRVGGPTPEQHNIISGNSVAGVMFQHKGVTGNVIAGNYIGTDITGSHALGNSQNGIIIWDGPCGNIMGGTGPGEGNLISGNGGGVMISGIDSNHNAVIGNFIGTDATGTAALGNSTGVGLCGAGFNRVEGNVISGNTNGAIDICEWGWPHSLIRGNLIGTDISGTKPLGNGVGIGVLGWHVLIGGATVAERNVIVDSEGGGIDATSAGTEYNWIAGNVIGTDAGGTISLGNGWAGVGLRDYSAHAFIQGNTIAFNGGGTGWWNAGVFVEHSLSNSIRRNSIYRNVGRGIFLAEGGNNLLPAPVMTAVTSTSVLGTACPGCTVEVFSDVEDEGRFYEGSTTADASGVFTFTKTSGLTGPFITATATDRDGNTSEFSVPQKVDQEPPAAPVLLHPANGAVLSDTTPTLTWQASPSPDAAGYLLNWNGTVTDVGNVTQYTTPVLADGIYTWTVAAYDAARNTSSYTDVWSLSVDATSPRIVTTVPVSGATDVSVIAPVVITFSEPVNAGTFTCTVMPDPGGWSAGWGGGTAMIPGGSTVTLTHNVFAYQTTYTVTITAASDMAGNLLSSAPYVWHFTTTPFQVYLPLVLR